MNKLFSSLSAFGIFIVGLMMAVTQVSAQAPLIDSSLAESAELNQSFSYTISASESPTSFAAAPLPAGLSRVGSTISGIPSEIGVFNITLFASNANGHDTAVLVLTVEAEAGESPQISSALSASGEEGVPFVYQIEASNSPTSFDAIGLEAFPGLSIDTGTGLISGTPTSAGSGDLIIQATNNDGTDVAVVALTITSAGLNAPTITSATVVSTTKGAEFLYQITASDNPTVFAVLSSLPAGLVREGSVISGIPTEAGVFNIELSASNSAGSGGATLELTVNEPAPVITSSLVIGGEVGSDLSYQITADNSPESFAITGLGAIPGLSLDSSSGLISGIPTISGDFDLVVEAINSSGSDSAFLRLVVIPESDLGTGPDVAIVSINDEDPASGLVFDGNTETLSITVEVTPDSGETLETVFVRWNNPPASSTAFATILAELQAVEPIPATGPITFSGLINIGPNPNNREIGGGAIELDVVATQRSANDDLSFGTSVEAVVEVAPLIDFLFPSTNSPFRSINPGEIFASVLVSTNAFQQISAQISGVGVISTVVDLDATDNPNGVFNFLAESLIQFPGEYSVLVTATDSIGNSTQVSRIIEISNAPSVPVASVASPTPGFSNNVFTPAIFTYEQDGPPDFTEEDGVITETSITYAITQLTEGSGYYPTDDTDINLVWNFNNTNPGLSGGVDVSGNTIEGGRLPAIADSITVLFPGETSGYGPSGSGLVDSVFDPGQASRIAIAAEFFRADSDLVSFKIFVNGEDVTPGNGNLDPTNGLAIDAPAIDYPATGTPDPGEYVVVAQVIDREGEVGTSSPLRFSITPYAAIDLLLVRDGVDEVDQGESVTYFIDIDPIDQIDQVEVFDSNTSESLGLATRVVLDDVVRYRFTRTYSQAGIFSIYVIATTFSDQEVRSNSATVQITPFNDLETSITSPIANDGETEIVREIFVGESVSFTANASSSAGITSFDWLVENVVVETDLESPFALSQSFETVGTFVVVGEALDNYGNRLGTEEVTVIVTRPDLEIEITSTTEVQNISSGESLTFTASATSELSVGSVVWYVNDFVVETDTAQPYALTYVFPSTGVSSVRAEAVDVIGNIETTPNVLVDVNEPNANMSDADFVSDIFNRLVGRVPSQEERDEANEQLDGSLEKRVAWVAGILESDELDSTTFVQIIYRTMTGEWPDAAELSESRGFLSDSVAGGTSQSGSIAAGTTQTFEFELNAGSSVTINVTGDNSNNIELSDPTLTINDPNGNFVAYSDDSFLGFSFSLDPSITFVPSQTGTYTATVGGFFTFQFGEFTITSSSVGSGSEGSALSAEALVTALIPEYESRFGDWLDDSSNQFTANPFVTQIFENKHGVAPTAQALARLGGALNGTSITSNGVTYPGYLGDVEAFVAGFAIDNELSGLEGAEGLPLSASLLYSRPNDAVTNAGLALAISSLLGQDPTDEVIASYGTESLEATIESILTDPSYYEQFPSNTAESYVALRLAELGVFNTNINGSNDDADSDGTTNLEEIALGTDPTDSSDFPGSLSSTIDGSDFVVDFLRLKDEVTPDNLNIFVECSASLTPESWESAPSGAITVSLDQSEVPDDYERVEFRIDMTEQDCSFVRVSVEQE